MPCRIFCFCTSNSASVRIPCVWSSASCFSLSIASADMPPAAGAAGGMTDNTIEQLGKLGQLHEQGVLTDAEFEVQKQKLLQGV